MNPYATTQNYQEHSVMSASPEQLVVLLYDGAIRFLRQAGAALGEGAVVHANDRLTRAEAIFDELTATLDKEQGGQVAESLHGIYVFWKKSLWEIRLDRDTAKLQRVIAMVASLREAWAEIAGGAAQNAAVQAP